MFTNRRIGYKIGKTLNLGDYESLRIDIETSADISDEQNIDEAKEILFTEICADLNERCEGLGKTKPIPKPPTKKP
jgi:hypothetical protein